MEPGPADWPEEMGNDNMDNDNMDEPGVDESMEENGDEGNGVPPPPHPKRRFNNYNRNHRYNVAYGNYRGGYGPGQGYGPFGPPGPGPMGPPPPPPPMFWGPPPRPRPTTNYRALNYLKRCGVPKEHLKNLPRDLLDQIGPDYCGLCGLNFESFATSRLHYISKNHLKKMKKWVANKPEAVLHQSKELPMKARELYCELCDVHITSKVHAESHYSGKPHRAIVEGRKNPKNPFLLQNNMAGRLEQLLRREKKNLKPLADEAPAEENSGDGTETPATKDKPVPPELYCDICKTSVTCSEQMTMHLNGKKHLTKEKQHILRMMKGDAPNNDKQEASQDKEEDYEKNKEEDNEEQVEDVNWPTEGETWVN